MAVTATGDLVAAHAEVVAVIQAIPDVTLDWQPGGEDWSLKQIIGHLAHANDFYIMIVDQARASNFGIVRLHRELAGWQRMADTDAQVAQCASVLAAQDCFERTYQRMLAVLQNSTPEELDQPLVFYSWRQDAEPENTTLRQRVIQRAAEHIREHQAQLTDTLARWQATQGASP